MYTKFGSRKFHKEIFQINLETKKFPLIGHHVQSRPRGIPISSEVSLSSVSLQIKHKTRFFLLNKQYRQQQYLKFVRQLVKQLWKNKMRNTIAKENQKQFWFLKENL